MDQKVSDIGEKLMALESRVEVMVLINAFCSASIYDLHDCDDVIQTVVQLFYDINMRK